MPQLVDQACRPGGVFLKREETVFQAVPETGVSSSAVSLSWTCRTPSGHSSVITSDSSTSPCLATISGDGKVIGWFGSVRVSVDSQQDFGAPKLTRKEHGVVHDDSRCEVMDLACVFDGNLGGSFEPIIVCG
jgi:hypothetical protein